MPTIDEDDEIDFGIPVFAAVEVAAGNSGLFTYNPTLQTLSVDTLYTGRYGKKMTKAAAKIDGPLTELAILNSEDIEKAHSYIVNKIQKNYDNKDFTPLTLHNMMHSFSKYFSSYTESLRILPSIRLDYGCIIVTWGHPDPRGEALQIKCYGANFSTIGTSKTGIFESKIHMKRPELITLINSNLFPDGGSPVESI